MSNSLGKYFRNSISIKQFGKILVLNSLGKYFRNSISVKPFGKIFQDFYQYQTVWEHISVMIQFGKIVQEFYQCPGPNLFDTDRILEIVFNVLVFIKTLQTANKCNIAK